MDLLAGLNSEQKTAVLHDDGPLLILAGAGSGKTRVLTHRIARLIAENKAKPWEIMAITFTNKAAKEMRDRIDLLMGDESAQMWVSTFHSICVRILRRDIEKLGYTGNFVIYDTQDKQMLLRDCLKELNINEKNYPPRMLGDKIGKAKDKLLSPEDYQRANKHDFREEKVCAVYKLYQQKLKENNALDFDDLIYFTIRLFKEAPAVLEYYQNKFKYLLVDEYQDTNMAQYMLVSMLAEKHGNLCVVGDDDQSIYAWRGADIRNILEFEKDFKGCKVIKLEQNYRSTPQILEAANKVIGRNTGRKDKVLWTSNKEGQKPVIFNAENQYEEARFVSTEVQECAKKRAQATGKELDYSRFAVLYRTNAQSRVFEEQFMKDGLPYRMFGGVKFYDRKEIKDVVAYLRVIMNPADSISLKRIINVPKRGLGATSVDRAERLAEQEGQTVYNIISNADKYEDLRRPMPALKKFTELMDRFIELSKTMSVSGLVEHVIKECGIIDELKAENTIEARSRIENIEEFISVAMQFDKDSEETTLDAFLSQVSLVSDIDDLSSDEGAIVMMTMHSAKGLEFPVVFLVGMEDGLFPGYNSINEGPDKIEEERRLCYVGMTRAEEQLYMTHANARTIFGKTERYMPSRFLSEIPETMFDHASDTSMFMMNKQRTREIFEAKRQQRAAMDSGLRKINNAESVFGISNVRRGFGSDVSASIKGSGAGGSVSRAGFGAGAGIGATSGGIGANGSGARLQKRGVGVGGASVATGISGMGANGAVGRAAGVAGAANAASVASFNVGDRVSHKKFGVGTVQKLDGVGDAQKIEIMFDKVGMKRLMTAYAELNRVD